ncbi:MULTISPECIES: ABC transporter substrate-binding protein [Brevibacillus]|jgi:raffinose/stachyose/melibiose transport system substrate-binding protein|uniref:ABC transporter substrate-binding protein n=1 Tax=Brevibacillus TaxID=55080 RepID=UPI0004F370A8|nr:extracellular solute-binding protein [Brevibacillus borstelensis]KKX55463.1 sugar ABC transporter substrate-binding protein [Brevibacillus borstelensis cifa_chp40]MED1744158.1 extracellular solute-binding protein [Brevibacillus borstelensis]MED2007751.1 extracellular solute-binding protein [Brevibacillus borstelensis]
MRRYRSRAFVSAMLTAMLVLAGCSGGTNSSPAGDGQSGGQTGNPGSSAGGGAEQVTLSMHSWRVEDAEGYKKIIQAFEAENPGIKIDFKPFKATEYNTILNTALQSDSGPDILQLRPYAPGISLAEAGHLEPLDQLPGIENFSKDVLAASTGKDGKVYGVPLSLNSTQIYYNKKLFEQNGLSEPKSWDELINTAKTLKDKGVVPFAFGAKEGWLLSLSHGVIAPGTYNGNAFIGKILNGEADFTSPEFVKSIQRMQELVPYFPENFVGLDLNDTRTMFFTEKAAMFINGSFELEGLQKMNPDLPLDFFPMPTDDGKTVLTTWVDGSYAVNAKSKHKAEALKFLEFMASKKFGELFANEFKRISAIPGVTTSDALVNKMAELSASSSTPYLMVVHFAEGNPTTKQTLENALQGMYLNKLTPEQVSQEVQKSAASWFPAFKK